MKIVEETEISLKHGKNIGKFTWRTKVVTLGTQQNMAILIADKVPYF
jgi:hypothetical protein